jgi:hypothetical protein
VNAATQQEIISLGEENIISRSSRNRIAERAHQLDASAEASVATRPRLPAAIPDERLDYYAWVFLSMRIFRSEEDLRTVPDRGAVVQPSGLLREYDPMDVRHEYFS